MTSSPLKKLVKRTAGLFLMSYIFSVLLTACLSSSSDTADKLICFDVAEGQETIINYPSGSGATRVCHGASQDYDGDGIENQYDGAAGDYRYFTSVSSDGYYEISNIQQLRAITTFQCPNRVGGISQMQCDSDDHPLGTIVKRLAAKYRLIADIDASSISSWEPIGSGSDTDKSFSGEFEGNGKAISNLSLSGTTPLNGLFGYLSGSVSNLILSNSRVEISNISITVAGLGTGTGILAAVVQSGGLVNNVYVINPDINIKPSDGSVPLSVGGLVGLNGGAIINSHATGINITETTGNLNIGGLVGWNKGAISSCYSTGIINKTGEGNTGGLVGNNFSASISNSYATGNVTGKESHVGGLVGNNYKASISNSYATGNVSGGIKDTGGLVGHNTDNGASIKNSYAIGSVTGGIGDTGGLVGENVSSASISNSYATGAVTGTDKVGGFVGLHAGGMISNSYATGDATGTSNVGGFVGSASGTIANSYATGAVTGTAIVGTGTVKKGTTSVGGFVGWNEKGTISNSYATGAVTGTANVTGTGTEEVKATANVGGFVGNVYSGTISNSYSTGVITGTANVTGTASVTGEVKANVGEFVGNVSNGTISNSYVTGSVTGTANVTGTENVTVAANVGGFVGNDDTGNIDGTMLQNATLETLDDLKKLTLGAAGDGWTSNNWAGMDGMDSSRFLPTLRSYKVDDMGQIQGDILCAQPKPRVEADGCGDSDEDGVIDRVDNCPTVANASQLDTDGDTEGDVCDTDDDGDGIPDDRDACPTGLTGVHMSTDLGGNSIDNDVNKDGCRDFEEGDYDNDGVADTDDQCQDLNTETDWTSTRTTDYDGDGCKDDTEDVDDDNDGLIEISTESELNNIRYNPEGTSYAITTTDTGTTSGCPTAECNGYELINDIKLANPPGNVWGNGNWSPVGTDMQGFTGTFDGNNHTISNLSIKSSSTHVGFFGALGTNAIVRNLSIEGDCTDHCIVSSSGTGSVGAIAGILKSGASLDNVSASINVSGLGAESKDIGGLVGSNEGTITDSYATGGVSGAKGTTGGLVGSNSDSISNSYATGSVTGYDGDTGGLVGINNGTITDSYASGDVTSGDVDTATAGVGNTGGLVGYNSDSISNSYATGSVTGYEGSANDTGGLVGYNSNSASISNSYASGDVTGYMGNNGTGGLVGHFHSGSINNSYAIGNVMLTTGNDDNAIGGLVGSKSSMTTTITDSYYSGTVDEGSGNTTDAGTSKTLTELKKLTLGASGAGDGWTAGNWAGMDSSRFLPTLRSSITGDILCGQSNDDHKPCPLAN